VNVVWRPGLSLDALTGAGVRRVSVGGALAWVIARALEDAGSRIHDGDLSVLEGPPAALDRWLG
jgi:hypothetical protein